MKQDKIGMFQIRSQEGPPLQMDRHKIHKTTTCP